MGKILGDINKLEPIRCKCISKAWYKDVEFIKNVNTVPVICIVRDVKGITVDKVYLATKYISVGDLWIIDPDKGEAGWYRDEYFAYDRDRRGELEYVKYRGM